jgi:Domain of unknown function (DUF4160)
VDDIDLASLQNDLALVDLLSRPTRGTGEYPVLEQLLLKKQNIKLKMYQERRHPMPHFHVDYGSEIHTASYVIGTGERIEGNLSRKYDRAISARAQANKDPLLATWNAMQSGESEQPFIAALGPL